MTYRTFIWLNYTPQLNFSFWYKYVCFFTSNVLFLSLGILNGAEGMAYFYQPTTLLIVGVHRSNCGVGSLPEHQIITLAVTCSFMEWKKELDSFENWTEPKKCRHLKVSSYIARLFTGSPSSWSPFIVTVKPFLYSITVIGMHMVI